jgi:single-strand DNA-binding protein
MMNLVALVGRLVADPELKYTPSGVAVCSLRIAVDRRRKSESGEKESDFFDVVAWQHSAEFAANYLTKGRLIAVEGRLQQRSWVQQDGQKRYKVEVVANSIQGLDRPKEGGQAVREPGPEETYPEPPPAADVQPDTDTDYDPFAEE